MSSENFKIQLRKGLLEFCILQILSKNKFYASEIIGMLNESNMNVVEGTVYPILNRLENKEYVNKARSSWTNQFWQDIREMGGTVSGLEGECEVEYSPKLDLNNFTKVE